MQNLDLVTPSSQNMSLCNCDLDYWYRNTCVNDVALDKIVSFSQNMSSVVTTSERESQRWMISEACLTASRGSSTKDTGFACDREAGRPHFYEFWVSLSKLSWSEVVPYLKLIAMAASFVVEHDACEGVRCSSTNKEDHGFYKGGNPPTYMYSTAIVPWWCCGNLLCWESSQQVVAQSFHTRHAHWVMVQEHLPPVTLRSCACCDR